MIPQKELLPEIFEWSQSRPQWQRDALRRLVVQGRLTDDDLKELKIICAASHGLAEPRDTIPLNRSHILSPAVTVGNVRIIKVTHHDGVNALARSQTITFGPGLTVVYGPNAAGKSGYTRILKQACRARVTEEILGNVLATNVPVEPSATIGYSIDGKESEIYWTSRTESHEALAHVSVFDSQCAAFYIGKPTDVAFRPFGLHLFDLLADACQKIREALDKDRTQLEASRFQLPRLAEDTAAQRLISGISSLTSVEEVQKLATLSNAEKDRLNQLRRQLFELQDTDPQILVRTLILRAERIERLRAHLCEVDEILSAKGNKDIFEARDAIEIARRAAATLRNSTFTPDLINYTGSELWRELWEVARRFSLEEAYPTGEFPATDRDARCVLCQQQLSATAITRLKRFEQFMQSSVQQRIDTAMRNYQTKRDHLVSFVLTDDTTREGLDELQIEADNLRKSFDSSLQKAQLRQNEIMTALSNNQSLPRALTSYIWRLSDLTDLANDLRKRAADIADNNAKSTREALSKELGELHARALLSEHIDTVVNEIERKKQLAAYAICIQDTDTRGITHKSAELTTRVITERLAEAFQDELRRLRFTHSEVELVATG